MERKVSLRGRLVCGVIALAALGMIIVDAASVVALHVYFRDRADAWLADTRDRIAHEIGNQTVVVTSNTLNSLVQPGYVFSLVGADGKVVAQTTATDSPDQPVAPPALPSSVDKDFAAVPTTIDATDSSGPQYRVARLSVGTHVRYVRADGGQVPVTAAVLAESLGPTTDAVGRLMLFEAGATVVALAGIGLLSFVALKVGLLPLRHMASTAHNIAAGDLSQRIDVPNSATEVGQVATALNEAFDARQRSEERLRRFVADASHELRTPLTTIKGWADMHQHGLAGAELTAKAMSRIQQEAARMQVLVSELLLLAELDRNHPPAAEPVDLGALAGDAVADARVADPSRRVHLTVEGDTMVSGDENRLRQVLQNLVCNALDHTPSGARIDIRVHGGNGTVELVVADDGPGMDEATASRAFERFYRADRSRTPGTAGTGLGLSIVRSIVLAHGGTVDLVTAEGGGSAFTVRLSSASWETKVRRTGLAEIRDAEGSP